MSDKKSIRRQNKRNKMAALIRLADTKEEASLIGTASPDTEHAQMIARLEEQMGGAAADSRKRTQDDEDEKSCDGQSDIDSSYRSILSKRRKVSEATKLAQFYIDQPYLSRFRRKHLLYDDNAAALTTPISLRACDVQQFIMYCLFGRNSLYRPRWCSIQYVTRISQMLVVVLDGWSWLDVNVSLPSTWTHTQRIFSDRSIRVISPRLYGGNMEEDIFMVPLPQPEIANKQPKTHNPQTKNKSERKEGIQLRIDTQKLLTADSFSRTLLLLSFTDLVAEGFPVPAQNSGSSEHELCAFKFSKSEYKKVESCSPLFAIDCEMVLTSDHRLSLASICVVDERLQVVYESLVKPDKPIKDYVSRYSGMTAERLADVTTTLSHVQRDLQLLLPADSILCGHSLNNDLVALQLYHPYVIDTSVCYNLKGMAHSKSSLKRLASQFLRKDIQTGSTGHCPEEDALTTMELVLLKLKMGYSFGNVMTDGLMSTPDEFFRESHPKEFMRRDTEHSSSQPSTDDNTAAAEDGLTSDRLANTEELTENATDAAAEKVAESESDTTISEPKTLAAERVNSKSKDSYNIELLDVDTTISCYCVFSRKHIPQLEVNMFDLIGHQDSNTAVICTNNISMREPQNQQSVTVHRCTKDKQVLRHAKRALKSGTNMVYCNLATNKQCTAETIQEKATSVDSQISKLWKHLPTAGLFCMVLTGTEHQHGSFMFAVKQQGSTTSKESEQRELDVDSDNDTAICYQ